MNGNCNCTKPNHCNNRIFMLTPLNKAYRHGWQTKGDALKLEIGLIV
jgi:hypothetical protein